mgnify:CR=1 FL=1
MVPAAPGQQELTVGTGADMQALGRSLAGRLRVERSAGSGQDYPHLYGELPLSAVLSARRMRTPEA